MKLTRRGEQSAHPQDAQVLARVQHAVGLKGVKQGEGSLEDDVQNLLDGRARWWAAF